MLGMVSRKNEANIMVKNAVDVIFGGLGFWMFGFAFTFGNDRGANPFSGYGSFFTDAEEMRMGDVFALYCFQASFATTATTIVSGAVAERMNLKAYIIFAFTNTLTYCFPAHWVWGENGWLKTMGVVDMGGASPVHLVGGVAGLVATIMLKPRIGRFKSVSGGGAPLRHNMGSPTNVLLGKHVFTCCCCFVLHTRLFVYCFTLSVCTSICMSVCLFACVCVSVCLHICLFACLPVCLSAREYVWMSVRMSVCVSVSESVRITICLQHVCLSVCVMKYYNCNHQEEGLPDYAT